MKGKLKCTATEGEGKKMKVKNGFEFEDRLVELQKMGWRQAEGEVEE